MHPAYSVILFTVSSGAGFGLLTWLGLSPLWGQAPAGGTFWAGFVLAFGLSVAGLLSSTFHLGHPERAWRAFSQWRSSWLSREGVLAVLTLGAGGLYALALLAGSPGGLPLGLLTALLSLATVHSTAMIYAQLGTVQRWHSRLTPAVFHGFALAGGALLMAAIRGVADTGGAGFWPLLAAVLLFAAWTAKRHWWQRGDATAPRSTPETATGLGSMGEVRLLESPHSGSNYLLKEMGFRVARRHAVKLRTIAIALGGFLPLILTLAASGGLLPAVLLPLAALAFLAGLLAERWLFFAEAEHSVMTYYDRG